MNRLSANAITLMLMLSLAALSACGATNTGNPSGGGAPGDGDAPAGVELLRSSLEREQSPAVSPAELTQAGQDSRDFALAMYAQSASGSDGDVFISPYSISVALAMTYAGARAETRSEMMSALHFGLPEPQLHAAWNATGRALESRADQLVSEESTGEGLQLDITNAVFMLQGFRPLEPFLDTLAQHYGAGIYAAKGDPEKIRVSINDWTAERTHDRIQDLLPPMSLDAAVLVLLNAIYFKASWLTPFDVAATRPGTFHAPTGDVMADMMHASVEQYAEGDGYQAVTLPYISPDVEMFVILPADGRLAEVEAGFDRAFFDRVHSELSGGYEVDLTFPRFTIDGETVSLTGALQALGMHHAFGEGGADLSGIGGDPGDLFISGVFHQAFIAVDEKGTEAAAATAVVVSVTSAPPPKTPVSVVVDRPCLFAIYDKPTGQILFVGRLTDPT
jgi:serpin B